MGATRVEATEPFVADREVKVNIPVVILCIIIWTFVLVLFFRLIVRLFREK